MKYNIEGNLNFYDELYKTLDENNANNELEFCLITNLPLTDNFVTLNCKHKFNYDALYKEIYNQKFKFRTYTTTELNLSSKDRNFVIKSGKDYYIKCPYCRNIQFDVLPDLNNNELYPPIYGINTTNRVYIKSVDNIREMKGYMYKGHFYDYSVKNKCNYKDCDLTTCAYDAKCKIYCCKLHMHEEIRKKKRELKEEMKQQIKEQKIKEKQEKTLLKIATKSSSKKVKNSVVTQIGEIDTYVPEENTGCVAILKSGINKGKLCGVKIFVDQCCKRHYKKLEENNIKDPPNNTLSLVDMKELEKIIDIDMNEK